MKEQSGVLLRKLLDRLYASLAQSPCLNCRVHQSRQRVDLADLSALRDLPAHAILSGLLDPTQRLHLRGQVPSLDGPDDEGGILSAAQQEAKAASDRQTRLLGRLRDIAEDARDYEEATGENALFLGFPLLSLPPGTLLFGQVGLTSRVLAPLGLAAVDLSVKRGVTPVVSLTAKGQGTDLLIPNYALLSWLEQQTGRDTSELFADQDGTDPWREIQEIAQLVASLLQIDLIPRFRPDQPVLPVPRAEALPPGPDFLPSAVLGLFPVSIQGLLRDMKALATGEHLAGPVEYFLSAAAGQLPSPPSSVPAPPPSPEPDRHPRRERLVAAADPFQAHAVRLAEHHPVLVIHGPPGTGKSQTITNIIGDHLARGERVLMVCDKRTAIDVVKNRLDHLGLGDLCAVVHDPQRDQNPLYMKIRRCLESLPERSSRPQAAVDIKEIDEELTRLHRELRSVWTVLAEPPAPGRRSFHDLVGEWLALDTAPTLPPEQTASVRWEQLAAIETHIQEMLERAGQAHYPHNPWVAAAGLLLSDLLSHPLSSYQHLLTSLQQAARHLDQTLRPDLPPLNPQPDLRTQAEDRRQLADCLRQIETVGLRETRADWFVQSPDILRSLLHQVDALAPAMNRIGENALEAEFAATFREQLPSLTEVNASLAALKSYAAAAQRWYGSFCLGRKRRARTILAGFGLPLAPEPAGRIIAFLEGVKARLLCQDFLQRSLRLSEPGTGLWPDTRLLTLLRSHRALLQVLVATHDNRAGQTLLAEIREALAGSPISWADRIAHSAERALALDRFLHQMRDSQLWQDAWLENVDARLRSHQPAGPILDQLAESFASLEDILRLRDAQARLPEPWQPPVTFLMQQGWPAPEALAALRRTLLAEAISRRLRETPLLQQVDQPHMQALFDRDAELHERKRQACVDSILHNWLEVQKLRLLASTRSQLNRVGANLKRRLVTRGQRALKLRQVIQFGSQSDESDPLFDMCPVWMASPATVAQIFPRWPLFDVIIFDEASQCRLEEAIPVLTRGQRVVIAGDPQQLPPTRFFESIVEQSAIEAPQTEQDLFEQQQAAVEDLLEAALNTPARRCHLHVHYRSRHDALIAFSNRHFYDNRLQPIPPPPAALADGTPIRLLRVDGVYDQRGNLREAQAAAQLVRQLLAQPEPPSIGVACFNLVQRELILDELDKLVAADPQFEQRYELARQRRGESSFEGLFVKNLENVQGDERDHLIISTTFGPDPDGQFRRHFGPVSQAGGGRRLNVLVTRARQVVHVLTSIPRTEYAALPQPGSGQAVSGRWLLYAYLQFAEQFQTGRAGPGDPAHATPPSPTDLLRVHPLPLASPLAQALGASLARHHGQHCDVHWGNPGFCIDLALRHSEPPHPFTLGVLCDLSRFDGAGDPVEWDLFRTGMLQAKGWKLHRLWSPGLFLDAARHQNVILQIARPSPQPNDRAAG